MRILIVGNGGREHALLWKLRRDLPGGEFWATRPNGGMKGSCRPLEIAPTDIEALSGWAASRRIDLTVVGPEAPLAMGIADRFRRNGLPVFGPSKEAARIEASKAFAKQLMVDAGVPSAGYRAFTELEPALAWVRERGAPIVVKASGLAAGKGAVVCPTVEDAEEALRSMLSDFQFGEAGREVVVEEFMEGEEISVFGVADGEDVVLLLPSQDHKRVGEGDTGPNTGGMGAYAPVSLATPARMAEARERIFLPVLRAMAEGGAPFQGLLYAGLMVTDDGLKVVEFNCRFGDPETQVVLPMMESSLLELLMASAEGTGLASAGLDAVRWRPGAALTTVLASGGYPGEYEKGKAIEIGEGAASAEDVVLFHAGTRVDEAGALVTSGGRVLACTGLGDTLAGAAAASRRAAAAVAFPGRQYRGDIGYRELERNPTTEVTTP